MIKLEVQDWNSQAIEAVLDDVLFYIVLDWNSSNQSWGIAIRNSAYETLIDGIMLVPNYPLTAQFNYEEMPAGELWVWPSSYTSGPIPRDGFSSGNYILAYETLEEVIIRMEANVI